MYLGDGNLVGLALIMTLSSHQGPFRRVVSRTAPASPTLAQGPTRGAQRAGHMGPRPSEFRNDI